MARQPRDWLPAILVAGWVLSGAATAQDLSLPPARSSRQKPIVFPDGSTLLIDAEPSWEDGAWLRDFKPPTVVPVAPVVGSKRRRPARVSNPRL